MKNADKQHQCHCLVRHALTTDERKAAVDNLNYSRSLGDTVGIMIGLMALGSCPGSEKSN